MGHTVALYFAFMEEATAVGLAAGGHVPYAVSVVEAARAGQRTLDHAYRLVWECYPGASAFREGLVEAMLASGEVGSAGYYTTAQRIEMTREHVPAMCEAIFREMVRHGMAYVPTHVTRKFEAMVGDPGFMDDPRLKYVTERQQRAWMDDAKEMVEIDPSAAGRQAFRAYQEFCVCEPYYEERRALWQTNRHRRLTRSFWTSC